jgi:spermidine/putrescine transport system substrate-binding protein
MKRLLLMVLLWGVTAGAAAAERQVYFYNWSEYLPEAVLAQFTKESGIKVVYTTYDSNEALYAKLKLLKGGGYDLVVPSAYFVSKMSREGMLQPLDLLRLGNLKNLDASRLNQPFDPGNRFSVPYLWGSTGILVDKRFVDPTKVTGWADLWRPEFRNQVLLLNDVRDVFFVALRVLGYSGNSTDPEELRKAYEKLLELRPNVRLFDSDTPRTPFLTGEVRLGMIWNGEAFMAQQENPNLVYIYPKEGAGLWMDNLVIPKGAKNVQEAHELINFLLRPEIARQISEEVGYSSPNHAAREQMAAEVRNDRTAYPAAADLAGAEFQLDVGKAMQTYEKYWERLKAGK